MNKLTSIRIKNNDGTYLEIPIGVLVQNVGYDSSHNLLQVLGTIDVESDGTIQAQINKLIENAAADAEAVGERVTVLESVIQGMAGGAPIVVASTSAMTDTNQIYVLSTDGMWYYHNGSSWTAGGEYGAVVTDTTLTQSGIPADAKAVGDKILSSENSVLKKINVDSQSFLINTLVAFETENSYAYLKFGGTRYSATPSLYIRGRKHKLIAIADYPDLLDTSPSGLSDCFKIPFTKSLIYDFDDDTLKIVSDSYANSNSFLIAYISSRGELYTSNRYYADYKTEKLDPYFVPYFFVNHLSAKINKINADLNGNKTTGTYGIDTESFVFITDVHWASNKKHSPGMIKEILKKTSVSTVICGGDLIQSYNPTKTGAVAEVRDFVDAITQIPCYEYYAVFGNHDSNANSNSDISIQFSRKEQYDMLYAPFASRKNVHWIWEEEDRVYQDQQTTLKNDYYFDHPRTRTRYLCIDWTNPLNGSRASWVSSVLARDDNYRVVVVYHGIYSGSGDELSPEHTGIMTLIEPYKSKVVALFTGHAHADAVIDYYGDGSVPVILTSCDTFRADRMTEGTLDEQCFDVAVINYTSNLIKLTRIGRGNDREVEISLV